MNSLLPIELQKEIFSCPLGGAPPHKPPCELLEFFSVHPEFSYIFESDKALLDLSKDCPAGRGSSPWLTILQGRNT